MAARRLISVHNAPDPLGMPAGGRRHAEKVTDLPRLERGGLGHVNF